MATKTWTLIDVDAKEHIEALTVTPLDVEGRADGYRIEKRTLRGGLQDGVEIVDIDNGVFRFTVLLSRGMGLLEAERDEVRFGWRSPVVEPVHPSMVPISEPSGLGWLDGFNEMFVRCGLTSNGAPEFDENGRLVYPLHGRIANIPARKVELSVDGDTGVISLTGVVRESRLFFHNLELETTYVTQVGRTGIEIRDVVTNRSVEPSEFQLLYHTNFGPPLLDEDGKFVLPIKEMAPRDMVAAENIPSWDIVDPETPGSSEVCFYLKPTCDENGDTIALLRNRNYDLGVAIGFNVAEFPCFSFWKSRLAVADGYVAGLEPATNYPNTHSFEKGQGRTVPLSPGESHSHTLTLTFLTRADAVHATEAAIADMQEGTDPVIHKEPQIGWSDI
jgi:galactose mutarotase-like enzyme